MPDLLIPLAAEDTSPHPPGAHQAPETGILSPGKAGQTRLLAGAQFPLRCEHQCCLNTCHDANHAQMRRSTVMSYRHLLPHVWVREHATRQERCAPLALNIETEDLDAQVKPLLLSRWPGGAPCCLGFLLEADRASPPSASPAPAHLPACPLSLLPAAAAAAGRRRNGAAPAHHSRRWVRQPAGLPLPPHACVLSVSCSGQADASLALVRSSCLDAWYCSFAPMLQTQPAPAAGDAPRPLRPHVPPSVG